MCIRDRYQRRVHGGIINRKEEWMSQIENKGTGRKLFKHYIQQNQQLYNEERLFFYRNNRWRFNSRAYSTPAKHLRPLPAILFGAAVILAYEFTWGQYAEEAHH
eukprot:TRINITY_DN2096_c0_g1_i1.p2 TRINITY_DN2096_c0_g1~~TRINITY_DN2096_c0_g1_i1.p2  ORF type:complete len:104 (-),score=36.65 TRINITY_DN2096_c0_g1_i1:242-553(-)